MKLNAFEFGKRTKKFSTDREFKILLVARESFNDTIRRALLAKHDVRRIPGRLWSRVPQLLPQQSECVDDRQGIFTAAEPCRGDQETRRDEGRNNLHKQGTVAIPELPWMLALCNESVRI